jgi:hypothetical protein
MTNTTPTFRAISAASVTALMSQKLTELPEICNTVTDYLGQTRIALNKNATKATYLEALDGALIMAETTFELVEEQIRNRPEINVTKTEAPQEAPAPAPAYTLHPAYARAAQAALKTYRTKFQSTDEEIKAAALETLASEAIQSAKDEAETILALLANPEAKASQTAKAKAATGTTTASGRRSLPVDAILTLVSTTNPKRPGSAAHVRFEHYFEKNPTTVEAALASGLTRADILYDLDHGYISLKLVSVAD